jgi:phospholipid-transporting ATPase
MTLLTIVISLLLYFAIAFALSEVGPIINLSDELIGIPQVIFCDPAFWFSLVLLPVLCLLRDFTWKFMRRDIWYRPYHIVQEIEAVESEQRQRSKSLIQHLRSATAFLNRGFAFSQDGRGEADLIRQYDTRTSKPPGI